MDSAQNQLAEKIKSTNNVLISVSRDPSVDQLSAMLGLALAINKTGSHAAAVFSGTVPSTLEFLQPEATFEKNTDSLRDFIIALDKAKADKLRYKVEDDMVRIFITPYKTSLSDADFAFSQGDFNVDLVIALGVDNQEDLDEAITAHGRILHDATVSSITTTNGEGEQLGSINWHEEHASSLSELVTELIQLIDPNLVDGQIATALLTGIVASTDRFSNDKTSSQTMSASALLMSAGANQQLVASKLETPPEPEEPEAPSDDQSDDSSGDNDNGDNPDDETPPENNDGTLEIDHDEPEPIPEILPAPVYEDPTANSEPQEEEQQSEPQPQPEAGLQPEPEAEPAPEPEAEPTPEPQPEAEPAPETPVEPISEPEEKQEQQEQEAPAAESSAPQIDLPDGLAAPATETELPVAPAFEPAPAPTPEPIPTSVPEPQPDPAVPEFVPPAPAPEFTLPPPPEQPPMAPIDQPVPTTEFTPPIPEQQGAVSGGSPVLTDKPILEEPQISANSNPTPLNDSYEPMNAPEASPQADEAGEHHQRITIAPPASHGLTIDPPADLGAPAAQTFTPPAVDPTPVPTVPPVMGDISALSAAPDTTIAPTNPAPDLGDARDEVSKALSSDAFNQPPEPIAALGAQPLGEELHPPVSPANDVATIKPSQSGYTSVEDLLSSPSSSPQVIDPNSPPPVPPPFNFGAPPNPQ